MTSLINVILFYYLDGKRPRQRYCTNPFPMHGGRHCPGIGEEIGPCLTLPPCPSKLVSSVPFNNRFSIPSRHQVLCISTCSTLKLVDLLFQPFSTFIVDFKPFLVISRLKSTKNVSKWTKINMFFFFNFCLLLRAGRHNYDVILNSLIIDQFITKHIEVKHFWIIQ